MCTLEFQYHDPDPQHTPEKCGFGITLNELEIFGKSLKVAILGLALPKAVPSLAVFA